LEYQDPWGEWARRRLLANAEEVDLYLGMVFHRFLSGEVPTRKLFITVNGQKVIPWDPFCRSEPKTEDLPAKDLQVIGVDGVGFVRVHSYVLPPQKEFSSDAAWRRASGPQQWNRQQGFYIYRANRMIQSGGWNRMRTPDEHTKLARVSIDFFPELDAVFGINIAKAYVNLPQDLREQLGPLVSQVTKVADQRYRSEKPKGTGGSASLHSRVGLQARSQGDPGMGTGPFDEYGNRKGTGGTKGVRPRKVIEEVARDVGEEAALKKIVNGLRVKHPEVARDLGW
jgi:hypothetical protein